MLLTSYTCSFENAAVRILVQPAGHFAVFQYASGPRARPDLLAALTRLGEVLAPAGGPSRPLAVLSDQRRMAPFTGAEIVAINQFWAAYLTRRGQPLRAAVLVAGDVFARLASSQLRHDNQQAALPITYRVFEDEASAVAWLAAQPV